VWLEDKPPRKEFLLGEEEAGEEEEEEEEEGEEEEEEEEEQTEREREREMCLHLRASLTFFSCVFLKFSSLFSSKKKLERRQKQE